MGQDSSTRRPWRHWSNQRTVPRASDEWSPAPEFQGSLAAAAKRGELIRICGASDPTYALSSTLLPPLVRARKRWFKKLLRHVARPVDLPALIARAVAEGKALLFCSFEDW